MGETVKTETELYSELPKGLFAILTSQAEYLTTKGTEATGDTNAITPPDNKRQVRIPASCD